MCLSEAVYKVVDYGEQGATEILAAIIGGFPPGMVSIARVEWSRPDAQHRCAPACMQDPSLLHPICGCCMRGACNCRTKLLWSMHPHSSLHVTPCASPSY